MALSLLTEKRKKHSCTLKFYSLNYHMFSHHQSRLQEFIWQFLPSVIIVVDNNTIEKLVKTWRIQAVKVKIWIVSQQRCHTQPAKICPAFRTCHLVTTINFLQIHTLIIASLITSLMT